LESTLSSRRSMRGEVIMVGAIPFLVDLAL
jgi:hypothetical protein